MKKIATLNEFVEKIDSAKKKNPKDLSSDQDLTIAIMQLISIEEHLIFSGAKTGKNHFYDMVQDIREMRKNLMLQIIPSYEGEVWCISKHLLSASMRLIEVGTKQQSLGNKEKAYDLFGKAYDLYCLFWGLNMGLVDSKDVQWQATDEKELEKQVAAFKVAAPTKSEKAPVKKTDEQPADSSTFSKLKAFVRKAVDCCIE